MIPGSRGRAGALGAGAPLSELRGIGPQRARALAAAGLETVEDLLFHLPFRYEDRRRLTSVAALAGEGSYLVGGRLTRVQRVRVRRRGLSLVRALLVDGSGELPVVWFNRPYLPAQLLPETDYLLYGELRRQGDGWQLVNPSCEPAGRALHAARLVPVYGAAGGHGPAFLRRLLDQILDRIDLEGELPERLPPELLERHGLEPLPAALRGLHRPADDADPARLAARRTPAHLRLIYGELLEHQIRLALARREVRRRPKRHCYDARLEVGELARELLPFEPTAAQLRVAGEVAADLRDRGPMLRLVQGDVGCGKTAIAAVALALAAESGLQAALMAPTELLAAQHHRTLEGWLGGRYRLALLTASTPAAGRLRRRLAAGDVRIVVGTHALIQEAVEFRELALVVVDEQHRFGVVQRQLLEAKGERPDLLVMTATPIPRSLALTAYGDLDLSLVDELPPGRQPVDTRLVPARARPRLYARLGERLAAGDQAYVVYPLIEESDRLEAASIEAAGEAVRRALPEVPSAVVHGRMPAAEREQAMAGFAAGRLRVLVATTVVEVGVDVPRATVMIIESAERYGLSQLHQLRGRVGRGERAGVCVAVHGRLTAEAKRRLEVFAGCNDGFQIAEEDLAIRGPGELLGTRQAGGPGYRIADLAADRRWLECARRDARELIARRGWPAAAALLPPDRGAPGDRPPLSGG